MLEDRPNQPPSPGPKRNTAHDPEKTPEPKLRPENDKPDGGKRPEQLTTDNDDGQG